MKLFVIDMEAADGILKLKEYYKCTEAGKTLMFVRNGKPLSVEETQEIIDQL